MHSPSINHYENTPMNNSTKSSCSKVNSVSGILNSVCACVCVFKFGERASAGRRLVTKTALSCTLRYSTYKNVNMVFATSIAPISAVSMEQCKYCGMQVG